MSRRQKIDCPHERRPGMAVCLHCLHEARVVARDRRRRAIIRFGIWSVALAVVIVVGSAGAGAVQERRAEATAAPRRAKRNPTAPAPPPLVTSVQDSSMSPSPAIAQSAPAPTPDALRDTAAPVTLASISAVDTSRHSAPAPVAAPATPAPPSTPAPSLPMPIVIEGRTDLPDSVFVVRTGNTVVVHFDTSPLRTRRADKFDHVVRQTLAAVYGPVSDTLLGAIPDGKLASPKELLSELPTRGIPLTMPNGARLTIWPETRAGRDGPLVVAYRATVAR